MLLYHLVQVVRKLVQVAYNSAISFPIDFRFSGVINWPKPRRFYVVQVVFFKIVQLTTVTFYGRTILMWHLNSGSQAQTQAQA